MGHQYPRSCLGPDNCQWQSLLFRRRRNEANNTFASLQLVVRQRCQWQLLSCFRRRNDNDASGRQSAVSAAGENEASNLSAEVAVGGARNLPVAISCCFGGVTRPTILPRLLLAYVNNLPVVCTIRGRRFA
jgi:hypothetical protein